ncbi:hypothetical protein D9611_014534 [Ephemerocybe angulata]|uniref:Proline dehydrogenase n=1 Tax=Ephemerocybe angulata TaxID=980116 RepID=A0A8H5BSX2_9AGAR|nr:hypothetical protein D9611_014534 [Tulosesus angulatus]
MQALLSRLSRTRLRGAPLFLLSATALPTYILLNSDSLPSPATPYQQPLRSLIRSYVVYSLCSIPVLVDNSPRLLETFTKIPGLREVTFGLVRITFFDQFVGGETASTTLPILQALRAANKGAIFAYSVEVDEQEAKGTTSKKGSLEGSSGFPPHKRIVEEIIRCIDVAADFEDTLRGARTATVPYQTITGTGTIPSTSDNGCGTWVAIKLTAMLPNAHALISLSKCITSAREQMTQGNSERFSGASYPQFERLLDISKGGDSIRAELIPFPGTPLPSDLEILKGSKHTTNDKMAMTTQDIDDIYDLYNDLVKICTRAQERGIKVLLDAEYSWYQPAIDALTFALMQKFNALPPSPSASQVRPLIYGTYQAYLRRTPLHLAYSMKHARENNYALGVKLVRGAYHHSEVSSHPTSGSSTSQSISPDPYPPVWSTKPETDEAYNDCVRIIISAVKDDIDKSSGTSTPREAAGRFGWATEALTSWTKSPPKVNPGHVGFGVLFGTHNWDSCNLILDELRKVGLGKVVTFVGENGKEVEKMELSNGVTQRVAIGQLYGMYDDLTDSIVHQTISSEPLAVKYLPYGGIKDVLPYLSRRAIENKSVLGEGGAARERQRAGRDIRKRIMGWFGVPE